MCVCLCFLLHFWKINRKTTTIQTDTDTHREREHIIYIKDFEREITVMLNIKKCGKFEKKRRERDVIGRAEQL